MSILWPFDDIFDISVPTAGSEFDILTSAFLSAIVPFLVLAIVIQLSCWLCCSGSKNRRKARAREFGEYIGSDAQLVAEARRWLKQATHDRQSAANDYISEYPAYEWVCFKCQQVIITVTCGSINSIIFILSEHNHCLFMNKQCLGLTPQHFAYNLFPLVP